MGLKLKNKELLTDTIKAFIRIKRYDEEYSDELEKQNIKPHTLAELRGIEPRSFHQYIILKYGADLTKKEYFEKRKELEEQVINHPKEFMDSYMSWFESIDYNNLSDDTKEKCVELLLVNRLSQDYGQLYDYNQEYIQNRYKTVEEKAKTDIFSGTNSVFCTSLSDMILEQTNYQMNSLQQMNQELVKESLDGFGRMFRESSNAMMGNGNYLDFLNGKNKTFEMEVPRSQWYLTNIFMKNEMGVTEGEVPKEYQKDSNYAVFLNNFIATLLNGNGNAGRTLQGVENYDLKSIYIDGESLQDIVTNDPSTGIKPRTLAAIRLSEAIKSGKAVDVAHSYVNGDGNLQTRIVPMSFKMNDTFSQEEKKRLSDEYHKKHHPIRYYLFNWGPFKLKDVDVLQVNKEKNLKNQEKRNKMILEHRNTTILNEINQAQNKSITPGKLFNVEVKTPAIEDVVEKMELNENDLQATNQKAKEKENIIQNDPVLDEEILVQGK